LPPASPHSDTERYLYRICELLGDVVDLLTPTGDTVTDGPEPPALSRTTADVRQVDEPAPVPRKRTTSRKAARNG
jgi:hypothetical protein